MFQKLQTRYIYVEKTTCSCLTLLLLTKSVTQKTNKGIKQLISYIDAETRDTSLMEFYL